MYEFIKYDTEKRAKSINQMRERHGFELMNIEMRA
jgi:phosphopantetheine adenylyltransferase